MRTRSLAAMVRQASRPKPILGAVILFLIVALPLGAAVGTDFPSRFSSSGDVGPIGPRSPAIDAGVDLQTAGVTHDIMGTLRPQGGAFDIGAFEYTPGVESPGLSNLVVPSAPPLVPTGQIYYLAPWGEDGNPGTLERPWRTLAYVAQRFGQPGYPGPGDTLYLRGGTYGPETAVVARAGQPGAPLTIAGYPGEVAVIDGSQDVSGGWEHVAGTVYRRQFTRAAGLDTPGGHLDPADVSTTPDGYYAAGDRTSYLYVDDQPDTDHWLRPYSAQVAGDGLGGAWANLPPRGFGTTAPPPPQQQGFYANRGDTLYVNLGHLPDPDPNHHRLRIPAYNYAFLLWGPSPGNLVIRDLVFQLHLSVQDAWSHADNVTLAGNEFRLFKQRVVNTRRCAAGWAVTGNWFHHYSYEAIHVESDRSLVAGNLMEHTLIGYAPWGPGGVNVLGSGNVVRGNVARHLRRQTAGNYSSGEATPFLSESWGLCGGKSAQENRFEGNVAYDIEGSMFLLIGADKAAVVNNLGYDLEGSGVTVVRGGTGGGLGDGDRLSTGHLIANNTFSRLGRQAIDLNNEARGVLIANNILDQSRAPYYFHGRATYELRANLDDGRDPGFVDPAADFRLLGGIPSRGEAGGQSSPTVVRGVPRYAAVPGMGVLRRARWHDAPRAHSSRA